MMGLSVVLAPRVPRQFDHDAEAAIADEQKCRLLDNDFTEDADASESEVRSCTLRQPRAFTVLPRSSYSVNVRPWLHDLYERMPVCEPRRWCVFCSCLYDSMDIG